MSLAAQVTNVNVCLCFASATAHNFNQVTKDTWSATTLSGWGEGASQLFILYFPYEYDVIDRGACDMAQQFEQELINLAPTNMSHLISENMHRRVQAGSSLVLTLTKQISEHS